MVISKISYLGAHIFRPLLSDVGALSCKVARARHFSCQTKKKKIAVVGSGQIGSILSLLAGLKNLGDVHLFDVANGLARGKALDLNQFATVEDSSSAFEGSSNYEDLNGTDVAIVTAGVPRKPGMSRSDLLGINAGIIKKVALAIKKYSPGAFVICITNPLDAMVHLFQKESHLPRNKVVGMAGVLDAARFKFFLARKLGVSSESIQTTVMGGHADSMCLFPRFTAVSGIPLYDLIRMKMLSKEDFEEVIKKTRYGGQEIVDYLKSGSAFFTPAAAAIQMAESYLYDKKSVLSCAAYLDGEYGVHGHYCGVPVIIGAQGVEKVLELALSDEEKKAFSNSIDEVKMLVEALKAFEAPAP